MRASSPALAVAALVLLAGCSSPGPAPPPAPVEDACASPCLAGGFEAVLAGCSTIDVSIDVPPGTYSLPAGYEPFPVLGAVPAGQVVSLVLWDCAQATVDGVGQGGASFAEVGVLVQRPEHVPATGADRHLYVLQQAAQGALLDALLLRGFPAAEGTASVAIADTSREGTADGAFTLRADVVHGEGGQSNFDASIAHHSGGGVFVETPDCTGLTPVTSLAVIDPGTSILATASPGGAPLIGGDGQQSPCTLRLTFEPVEPAPPAP